MVELPKEWYSEGVDLPDNKTIENGKILVSYIKKEFSELMLNVFVNEFREIEVETWRHPRKTVCLVGAKEVTVLFVYCDDWTKDIDEVTIPIDPISFDTSQVIQVMRDWLEGSENCP